MKKDAKTDQDRRHLLKGLAGTAVAGALVSSANATAGAEVVKPESTKEVGYRETQHVKDYYDTL